MRILISAALLLALAPSLIAQWQATSYELKGGWNAIYLHGEATHASPDALFAAGDALNIDEVWRWNPNPTQIQFTTDPQIPTPGTPEWSTWYRGNPGASTLTEMVGQTAYLVRCSGTATDSYTVQIKHRPLPPSSTWVRNGANLLGFPSSYGSGSFPTISSYFTTFPAAVAANTKIFKYVGGELGPGNPIQVFSPTFEPLDRNQAYWFEAEVVGNFYAPIEVAPSNLDGLDFGRTGSLIAVRLRNRTSAPVTITVTPAASAAAPQGEEAITGQVPLTRRTFDVPSNQFVETPIAGAFNVVIGAQTSIELEFGIDRGAMSMSSNDFYASFLRFEDSGDLMDVLIPARARVASFAGLWVGNATVSGVESTAAGSPGTTTARPFPLRYLMHVDDAGTARILSQVFVGTLDASGDWGVCTNESALDAAQLGTASRLVSGHLPLDQVLGTPAGTGSVALGSTLTRGFTIGFDDPANPFVHQYHPDHDNRSPRLDPLGAGEESYDIGRTLSFEFLAAPPGGASIPGWGSTVLGGNYSETISGLHRQDLNVTGSFTFRRVNEIGSITTTP